MWIYIPAGAASAVVSYHSHAVQRRGKLLQLESGAKVTIDGDNDVFNIRIMYASGDHITLGPSLASEEEAEQVLKNFAQKLGAILFEPGFPAVDSERTRLAA